MNVWVRVCWIPAAPATRARQWPHDAARLRHKLPHNRAALPACRLSEGKVSDWTPRCAPRAGALRAGSAFPHTLSTAIFAAVLLSVDPTMSHMSAEELRAKQEVERLRMEEMDEVTKEFPHFSRTKLEQMKRKFMEYDLDNSGDLDLFEVQKMMEKLGQPKTRAELVQLIAEVDTSNTGKISFREYLMVRLAASHSRHCAAHSLLPLHSPAGSPRHVGLLALIRPCRPRSCEGRARRRP